MSNKAKMKCRECGSTDIRVDGNNPLARLGGLKENGVPNVEVYCFKCTAAYCTEDPDYAGKDTVKCASTSSPC